MEKGEITELIPNKIEKFEINMKKHLRFSRTTLKFKVFNFKVKLTLKLKTLKFNFKVNFKLT